MYVYPLYVLYLAHAFIKSDVIQKYYMLSRYTVECIIHFPIWWLTHVYGKCLLMFNDDK